MCGYTTCDNKKVAVPLVLSSKYCTMNEAVGFRKPVRSVEWCAQCTQAHCAVCMGWFISVCIRTGNLRPGQGEYISFIE